MAWRNLVCNHGLRYQGEDELDGYGSSDSSVVPFPFFSLHHNGIYQSNLEQQVAWHCETSTRSSDFYNSERIIK